MKTAIGTGKSGEDLAVLFLKNEGYRIIERNYRCPLGEMDIVAADRDVLAFIEVKSRRNAKYGDPQLAVGVKKQQKLSMVAQYYLKERRLLNRQARFDVVAVRMSPQGNRVELIRDAFQVSYGW